MSRSIQLAVCLVALLCTAGAWAQSQDAQTDESVSENSASTPVAHVYVGNGTHILAFSAAANGKLTAVSGSPFNYNTSLMGANGHFLFGFEPGTVIIDSLSMASSGALKKVATTNTETYWPDPSCPMVTWNGQGLRIDHTGLDLYNAGIPGDFGCYSSFQSFKINDTSGKLTYLGETDGIFNGGPQMSILGNNDFAYSVVCEYPYGNGATPEITAFQRLSSGELMTAKAGVAIPAAPTNETDPNGPTPGYYCPINMATDPTNHAAITYFAVDENGVQYGPAVIATYTADAKGNLTTTSTYKNMATLPTGSDGSNTTCLACAALRMSPSGKLLAAGGSPGVVLYHFNAGSPATKYKTLLAGNSIGSIFWDNENHLYALGTNSKGASMLWVYTVTPTSTTEAPGSPYSIANAGSMIVQPL
jgi:hypothetical protein